MKTELVDVNETRKNLMIEIPSDIVDAEISKVASRYGKQARLPGFRPGKVPPKVIRQRFKSEIMHDVAHHLVEHAMEDALAERGVEPVDTPEIRDLKLEEGQALTFKAEFDVVPTFDPGEFGGIEVRRTPVVIEDTAVEHALEQMRDRAARFEPVEDSVVGAGHTVVLDIERQGFDKNGRAGEKTKHERVPVEIGAAANPPGFDAELLGLTSGTTKSFRLRFPDDYSVPELAGTDVAYTVTVHDIRQRVVPTLDDEFAKDLGEFDNLEALRARVRQDLEVEARESAERQVRTDVLKKLAERVPFTLPASLVNREIDRRIEEFARRLMDQRIDPRQANIDWAAFREAQREPATEAVASALVLDEVARREDIGVSEADIDGELEKYSARSGLTVPAVRARLEDEGAIGRLAAGLRREKALGRVMDRVNIVSL
ncbi:MAG TPA: trigger factor [Vicinamibacterales bacterium]|nr:trigger factor [Vicinamibacterales bacterium]